MVDAFLKQAVIIALGSISILHSPACAHGGPPIDNAGGPATKDQSRQITPGDQSILWDDAKIVRARSALISLEVSRKRLVGLMGRLRISERSAAYAENLGRSGEASYWRRDIAQIRPVIDSELKRAKPLAAEADVRCGGCTYSDLISKVRKAIDDAVALRSQAATSAH